MWDYLLNAFVTLFVTVDPPGLVPIFIAVTARMTSEQRRQVAVRSSLIAGAVLFAFALVGEALLGALGISVPAFRIAGGLLLFYIAFEMVFAKRSERKTETAGRSISAEEVRHLAVFPIAIPLIAGPGAISATILAASQAPSSTALVLFLAIVVVIVASCLGVFLVADRLNRALGETGRVVIERLLGLILSALAVQFVADGVKAIMKVA